MRRLYNWWHNRNYKYVGIWSGDVLTGHKLWSYRYDK